VDQVRSAGSVAMRCVLGSFVRAGNCLICMYSACACRNLLALTTLAQIRSGLDHCRRASIPPHSSGESEACAPDYAEVIDQELQTCACYLQMQGAMDCLWLDSRIRKDHAAKRCQRSCRRLTTSKDRNAAHSLGGIYRTRRCVCGSRPFVLSSVRFTWPVWWRRRPVLPGE
jgi:hypothetical protein